MDESKDKNSLGGMLVNKAMALDEKFADRRIAALGNYSASIGKVFEGEGCDCDIVLVRRL